MAAEPTSPYWQQLRQSAGLDYEYAHITQPIPIATNTPLDAALGGGIPVGTFTVIGGEAGTGKSALAVMAAYYAAKAGRHPVFFSMEMPAKMVIDRMLSIHSVEMQYERYGFAVPSMQVWWSKTGDVVERLMGGIGPRADMLALDDQYRYQAAMSYMSSHGDDDVVISTWRDFRDTVWPNMIVTDAYTSIEQACNWVGALASEGVRPFPIIDYIQLGADGQDSEYENVTRASHLLAHTCRQWNVPMLCISSLRNVGANERNDTPRLGWFRGSGHIGYDAGTAVVLMRDGEPDGVEQRVVAHVIKNRIGEVGDTAMLFNGAANWFRST